MTTLWGSNYYYPHFNRWAHWGRKFQNVFQDHRTNKGRSWASDPGSPAAEPPHCAASKLCWWQYPFMDTGSCVRIGGGSLLAGPGPWSWSVPKPWVVSQGEACVWSPEVSPPWGSLTLCPCQKGFPVSTEGRPTCRTAAFRVQQEVSTCGFV